MDLIAIAQKMWRYKLATLLVLILTICGAAYVLTVKKPVYEASSSYILINPPPPPSAEEVARRPRLGRIRTDNPYTRFTDQSAVVEILSTAMNAASARAALVKAGADRRYKIGRTLSFGSSSPLMEITGVASNPRDAIRTAEIVGAEVLRRLDDIQQVQGVHPKYRIKTSQVTAPEGAHLRASGQIRALVGVLALGAILMFVVISLGDAISGPRKKRRANRPAAAHDGPADHHGPAAHDGRAGHGGPAAATDDFAPSDKSRLTRGGSEPSLSTGTPDLIEPSDDEVSEGLRLVVGPLTEDGSRLNGDPLGGAFTDPLPDRSEDPGDLRRP